jgi:hypothetical protein
MVWFSASYCTVLVAQSFETQKPSSHHNYTDLQLKPLLHNKHYLLPCSLPEELTPKGILGYTVYPEVLELSLCFAFRVVRSEADLQLRHKLLIVREPGWLIDQIGFKEHWFKQSNAVPLR